MPRRNGKGTGDAQVDGVAARLAAKWNGPQAVAGEAQADWANVDGRMLYSLIAAVGLQRGAVLCGVDRLGTGLTMSIWLGGEKVLNKYYNPRHGGYELWHEDVEEFLDDLAAAQNP